MLDILFFEWRLRRNFKRLGKYHYFIDEKGKVRKVKAEKLNNKSTPWHFHSGG